MNKNNIELSVICWKWKQENYRSIFTSDHVHRLKNMVERNLKIPYRFLCITDDPEGIDCETIPLWDDPQIFVREKNPNCYRRLKTFSTEAKDIFKTDWVLSIDLDTVIVSDFTDLISNPTSDFIIWKNPSTVNSLKTYYNGGFWLLKLGQRTKVWETLSSKSQIITQAQKIIGSDQAWISHVLGPGEKTWGEIDGIYSFRKHIKHRQPVELPSNSRIISFHGNYDPTDHDLQSTFPWIKEHYR